MVDQQSLNESPPTVGPGDGGGTGETTPIQLPENRVSDGAWGINDSAGGANSPGDPDITTDPC